MTQDSGRGVVCKDYTLSNEIIQLYHSADVQDVNEAITVFFHAFMMESGFIPKEELWNRMQFNLDLANKDLQPCFSSLELLREQEEFGKSTVCLFGVFQDCAKDVPASDKYHYMPKEWNTKGMLKIKYEHFCCSPVTCYMTCVPLYSNMCVHGIICDVDCVESVDLKVNVNNYIKNKKNVSNLDVQEAFSNVPELSRYFKDGFCLPLLNLFHETIGKARLYGLRGLFDEMKVYILQLLPVEYVISMSAVNKNFNYLANLPFLWKYLYERDFDKGGVLDIDVASSSDINWKQMYKTEYRKKKHRKERSLMTFDFRQPRIFNFGPDFDTDISIHFDPPPPQLFPPPQNIFPLVPRYPYFRRLL